MSWRIAINQGESRPLSEVKTALLLGCSPRSVADWSKHHDAPRYIGLACAAIAHGIKEWGHVETY